MSRLIMRSVVDLPHPDGPDEHRDLALGHLEAQVADRRGSLAREDLADVLELDHRVGSRCGVPAR